MKKRFIVMFTVVLGLLSFSQSSHAFRWFSQSTYTDTRYPIVLVHGLYGFDNLIGIDYFYKITEELESDGAEVYTVVVSGVNSTEVRGEQLVEQLEELSIVHGVERFNLIGHSHGAPTSRYAASVSPHLVASVTSVGGVNKGSKVADLIELFPDSSLAQRFVAALGNGLGKILNLLAGGGFEPDFIASLTSLSTKETLKFNERHPQGVPVSACGEGNYVDNGIAYFSWSGTRPFTNILDPIELLFITGNLIFAGEENDGLVSRCSSHLGKVIRDDYSMNHLDEVNLMFGLHHIWSTDPLTVYRQHANRLKNAGL